MSAADKKRSEQRSQRDKFIDTARKLGCDEDEKAFADKLRRIGKASPPKDDARMARRETGEAKPSKKGR